MSYVNKLICALFGHRYYVIKTYSDSVRHIGCSRCGKEWGMHDGLQCLVEWDRELEIASEEAWPEQSQQRTFL